MSQNQYFYKEKDGKFFFLCEDGEFVESIDGKIPNPEDKYLHIERTICKATEFAKVFKVKLLITRLYMDGVMLQDVDVKTGLIIRSGYNLKEMT